MPIISFTESPFFVLNVSPRANVSEIEDACEDAIIEHPEDEARFLRLKAELLTPLRRLKWELLWPVELAPTKAATIVEKVVSGNPTDIPKQIVDFPSHSKFIVATAGTELHKNLELSQIGIEAFATISIPSLAIQINSVRRISGIAPTSADQVAGLIGELLSDFSKSLVCGFHGAEAGQNLANLIQTDEDAHNKLKGEIIREFEAQFSSSASNIREKIDSEFCRIEAGAPPAGTQVAKDLETWGQLHRPSITLAAQLGLDEERSLAIYEKGRSVCIDLANNQDRYEHARDLAISLQANFQGLPSSTSKSSEDIAALDNLILENQIGKAVDPLKAALGEIRQTPSVMANDAGNWAKSQTSGNIVAAFRNAFQSAVDRLSDGEYAFLPFRLVRECALELNNADNNPLASRALLEGMVVLSPIPSVIKVQIDQDFAHFRSSDLQAALLKSLENKNTQESIDLIDKLVSINPDDSEQLNQIKQQLVSNQEKARGKYIIWGVIAAGIILVAVINQNSQNSYTPTYTPTYTDPTESTSQPAALPSEAINNSYDTTQYQQQTEAVGPPADDADSSTVAIPPVGTSETLDIQQLRYCAFEKIRLTTAQSLVTSNSKQGTIDAFNTRIDDYNSRCGSFRYLQSDYDRAQTDASAATTTLNSEASTLVEGWQRDAGE